MLITNLFSSLFKSSNFHRIVMSHIKPEYFFDKIDKTLFETLKEYHTKYNKQGTFNDIKLLISMDGSISENDTEALYERMKEIKNADIVSDEELLINSVEEWCKDRALDNAILYAVDAVQNNKSKGSIREEIEKALAVQFEVKIGHDYYQDALERMKWYYEDEDKIPVDIDVMNQAMGGGLVKKAMFIILSSTNVGKTSNLCHYASSLVRNGNNVLYISGEESSREILRKNDANLLDIGISSLNKTLDKNSFKSKFKDICNKTHGKFIVKEYPTGAANTQHIRNLLVELKNKKNFVPDVVVLDGLNNFASSKIPSSQAGTPIYVKNVAEEQRALASEFNYALFTNAQFNRNAKSKKTDADLEDVGECYAIVQACDWASSLIQTDELREQGKYLIKNLKTRFGSNKGKIYTIGIDFEKMRLFNLSEDQQEIPKHLQDQIAYNKQQKELKEENILNFDFNE